MLLRHKHTSQFGTEVQKNLELTVCSLGSPVLALAPILAAAFTTVATEITMFHVAAAAYKHMSLVRYRCRCSTHHCCSC